MSAAIKEGKILGRVVAIGTPAEEGGGGKIKLIKAGIYKDIFCCMMVHAMYDPLHCLVKQTSPMKLIVQQAIRQRILYKHVRIRIDHRVHWETCPRDGRSLGWHQCAGCNDLATHQHWFATPADHAYRSDPGVVLSAGESSGVIPHYSKARYCVRSASLVRYRTLKRKFINCLEAAALATGCELKTDWMPAYWDIRVNHGYVPNHLIQNLYGIDWFPTDWPASMWNIWSNWAFHLRRCMNKKRT